MTSNYANAFKEEATELLAVLETSLLELEGSPDDKGLIDQVFRALHTIKGSGSMFGFEALSKFVHNIETAYDLVRNEKFTVSQELIDLTLAAKDQISIMINNPDEIPDENSEEISKTVDSFNNIIIKHGDNSSIKEEKIDSPEDQYREKRSPGIASVYHIKFVPESGIFLTGAFPDRLVAELAEMGNIIILPHTDDIPLLNEFNPEHCYTSWDLILETAEELNSVKDVFMFVEDSSEVKISNVSDSANFKDAVNEVNALKTQNKLKADEEIENFIKKFVYKKNGIETSKEIKKPTEQAKETHKQNNVLSSVRVRADKLDILVNLVGELVTVQARLNRIAAQNNDTELTSTAEEVERLTWELRDSALSIRMLPIGTTFSKFKRLVRDLSKELGKEVELITEGGETELDKNVIEKLNDPLVHIIRNSIDHGIESPEERIGKNKLEAGSIILSAVHSGTHVLIIISDDGRGLDKDKIYTKAIEKELIPPDANLTDKEIYNLIFNPGFSTAQNVTNVSGRGVGMDIVRTTIESIRGSIDVESKPDNGTTITLKLPLTLAIIEGLIVRINKDYFVVPLSFVEECVEFTTIARDNTNGRNIINVRGEVVPFIPLRERFDIYKNQPSIEQIVIINDNGVKAGLVVDEIIGEQQIVIKSLGTFYKHVEMMSGATVLGDGTVALIVDVSKLISTEIRNEIK